VSEELKPVNCGCGGNWTIVMGRHPIAKYIYWYVRCEDCGTRTDEYDTKEQAITAWNKAMSGSAEDFSAVERTAKVNVSYRDESVVFGFCECGQSVNTYSTYCPVCGARLEWE